MSGPSLNMLLFVVSLALATLHVPLTRQLPSALQRWEQSDYVNLTNYLNVSSSQSQYYGWLEVGSPPQSLSVLVDTGSAVKAM